MHSVFLLRHCEYENPRNILPGRLPLDLSEVGKSHAKRLAEYFSTKHISRIYSSAVARCKQTAQIVSDEKIPITFDQRLLETFSAYQGFWEENWHGAGFHFFTHRQELGGENMANLKIRMANFWDEIVVNVDSNIVICSHGDPLLALYSHIFKTPLVSEDAQESDIVGWLEKGDFMEVICNGNQVIDVRKKMTV